MLVPIRKFGDIERHSYGNQSFPEYLVNNKGEYFDLPQTPLQFQRLKESEGDLYIEPMYFMAQTTFNQTEFSEFEYY